MNADPAMKETDSDITTDGIREAAEKNIRIIVEQDDGPDIEVACISREHDRMVCYADPSLLNNPSATAYTAFALSKCGEKLLARLANGPRKHEEEL